MMTPEDQKKFDDFYEERIQEAEAEQVNEEGLIIPEDVSFG